MDDNMIIEQQLSALGERKLPESPRLIGGFFHQISLVTLRFQPVEPARLSLSMKRHRYRSGEEAAASAVGPPGVAGPAGKELIPEKYNKKTILCADVKPRASNQFEFSLMK
jgi:hypothetical protein